MMNNITMKQEAVIPMSLPMPLGFFTDHNIASRTTIWRWEKEGLRVIRKGGRSYVIPEELRDFLVTRDSSEVEESIS